MLPTDAIIVLLLWLFLLNGYAYFWDTVHERANKEIVGSDITWRTPLRDFDVQIGDTIPHAFGILGQSIVAAGLHADELRGRIQRFGHAVSDVYAGDIVIDVTPLDSPGRMYLNTRTGEVNIRLFENGEWSHVRGAADG